MDNFSCFSNTSFSKTSPFLQLAWDSTSLGEIKSCPRKYYYTMIEGWEPKYKSVHLEFGIWLHEARESYDHAKAKGAEHEEALRLVVKEAMVKTWDKELSRPWISTDENKNRYTLVRSIVWYLDALGKDDPLKTIILSNGKPAVELSFELDSGYKSNSTRENYLLCGHMDRMAKLGEDNFILDIKTTKTTIGANFFDKYSPDNQFSLYSFAGKIVFSTPTKGLLVDALQIAITFTRVQRGLVQRTEAELAEWHDGLGWWLYQANWYAQRAQGLWEQGKDPSLGYPMNDKSCDQFGACKFRNICARAPGQRKLWFEGEFRKRIWDPLRKRGDI